MAEQMRRKRWWVGAVLLLSLAGSGDWGHPALAQGQVVSSVAAQTPTSAPPPANGGVSHLPASAANRVASATSQNKTPAPATDPVNNNSAHPHSPGSPEAQFSACLGKFVAALKSHRTALPQSVSDPIFNEAVQSLIDSESGWPSTPVNLPRNCPGSASTNPADLVEKASRYVESIDEKLTQTDKKAFSDALTKNEVATTKLTDLKNAIAQSPQTSNENTQVGQLAPDDFTKQIGIAIGGFNSLRQTGESKGFDYLDEVVASESGVSIDVAIGNAKDSLTTAEADWISAHMKADQPVAQGTLEDCPRGLKVADCATQIRDAIEKARSFVNLKDPQARSNISLELDQAENALTKEKPICTGPECQVIIPQSQFGVILAALSLLLTLSTGVMVWRLQTRINKEKEKLSQATKTRYDNFAITIHNLNTEVSELKRAIDEWRARGGQDINTDAQQRNSQVQGSGIKMDVDVQDPSEKASGILERGGDGLPPIQITGEAQQKPLYEEHLTPLEAYMKAQGMERSAGELFILGKYPYLKRFECSNIDQWRHSSAILKFIEEPSRGTFMLLEERGSCYAFPWIHVSLSSSRSAIEGVYEYPPGYVDGDLRVIEEAVIRKNGSQYELQRKGRLGRV